MSFQNDSDAKLKRIEDCRELYLKHGGRQHGEIEREMRELGHTDFHRRILYSRFERGHHRAGWIERYGFLSEPPAGSGQAAFLSEPPALAGGLDSAADDASPSRTAPPEV